MKRRGFIKGLPLLPIAIAGVLVSGKAEAKEQTYRHKPLLWGDRQYPSFSFHDDISDIHQDVNVCKHCGILYGTEVKE